MKRRHFLTALVVVFAAGLATVGGRLWLNPVPPRPPLVVGALPKPCHDRSFEGVPYAICAIDPLAYSIIVARTDAEGKAYGSLDRFDAAMAEKATPVLLAMNGGMYHEGLGPVGLFVEDGRQETPLNTADAEGNFFLKPTACSSCGRTAAPACWRPAPMLPPLPMSPMPRSPARCW
jgi:hypothetical protein